MNLSNRINVFIVLSIILLLYSSSIGTMNLIHNQKIGYVDTGVLMEQYPAAKVVRKELDKKSEEWKKNLNLLESEINNLNQEMLQNAARWDKRVLAEMQDSMKSKQSAYARYNRAVSQRASEMETELFKPVLGELNARISEYGRKNGYDMVFGTMTGGNILYAQEASDLTNKFLEYVKKDLQAAK